MFEWKVDAIGGGRLDIVVALIEVWWVLFVASSMFICQRVVWSSGDIGCDSSV